MNLCVHEKIFAANDRCGYISEHCEEQNYLQFIKMYFCTINENIPALILSSVIQKCCLID